MTLNAYLNRCRSVKRSNHVMSWNAWEILMALFLILHVFWRNNMASAVENTSWNPLEMDIRDAKFQNISRRLSRQKLVPLVRAPKSPTIHYQQSLLLKNFLTALSIMVYWPNPPFHFHPESEIQAKILKLHAKSKIWTQKIDKSITHCNCRIPKSVKISLWIWNPRKKYFQSPPIRSPSEWLKNLYFTPPPFQQHSFFRTNPPSFILLRNLV